MGTGVTMTGGTRCTVFKYDNAAFTAPTNDSFYVSGAGDASNPAVIFNTGTFAVKQGPAFHQGHVNYRATFNTAAGDLAVTAAQIGPEGVLQYTGTGGNTFTLPTAASIDTQWDPSPERTEVGDGWHFWIVNDGSGAALTIAGNTGLTLLGGVTSLAAGDAMRVVIFKSAATAYTLRRAV